MGETNPVVKHVNTAIEIMIAAGSATNVILGTATALVMAWRMAFPKEADALTVPQIAQMLRDKVARNNVYGEAELARLDAIIAAQQ